jgi:Flp pilus assembly protein CpaB
MKERTEEMKLKKYLHILLAIMLAAGAAVAGLSFINANTPTVKVVASTTKIPVGTVINSNHVKTKLVAKSSLPPNTVTKPEEVIGKTTTMTLLNGDILRKEHVIAGKGSLNAKLVTQAPGRVAVDLPKESAQGLIGLETGDRVNIYGETSIIGPDGKAGSQVQKVAGGAMILYAPPADIKKDNRSTSIIIACLPEEEANIADVLTRGKRVTLFLQGGENK